MRALIDNAAAPIQKGAPLRSICDQIGHCESITLTTLGDGHTVPSKNAVTRAASTKPPGNYPMTTSMVQSGRSTWDEVARYLFPFDVSEQERYVCVATLAAYFDESCDSYCFSVSGYVAGYGVWLDLDARWRDVLKKWNVEYFKSSECETLVGEFLKHRENPAHPRAPMTLRDKQTAKCARTDFTDVICKVQDSLCGIGAVLIKQDFERIISESDKALFLFGSEPYFMCLQMCLTRMVTRLVQDNGSFTGKHWIKPIFDTHEEHAGRAKILYDKFKAKNPKVASVLLPLDYEDDKDTPALQASDFLAYEVRKYLIGEDVEKRARRVSLERISPTIYAIDKLDYQALTNILERQP